MIPWALEFVNQKLIAGEEGGCSHAMRMLTQRKDMVLILCFLVGCIVAMIFLSAKFVSSLKDKVQLEITLYTGTDILSFRIQQ